jgi:hypothetical protein
MIHINITIIVIAILLLYVNQAFCYAPMPYFERMQISLQEITISGAALIASHAILLRFYLVSRENFKAKYYIALASLCFAVSILLMTGFRSNSEKIYYQNGIVALSMVLPVSYAIFDRHTAVPLRIVKAGFLLIISYAMADYLIAYRKGIEFISMPLN